MYPNYENNFNHESDPNFTQPESGAPQRPTEFIDIRPAKPKRQRRFAKTLAACLCCAVIGGVAGGAGVKLADGMGGAAPVSTVYEGSRPAVISTAAVDSKTVLSATEVYNANLPSVVGINGNVTTNIWGQTVKNAVSGSGFVISSDGYIITNYHVINGVSDISAFFSDGTSYDAQVVGGEEDNDIAGLKIDARNLRPVVLGDSSAIQIGEHVIGRCADVVCRDMEPLNIFVYADTLSKLARCQERAGKDEHLSEKEMLRKMKQIDRERMMYRALFTEGTWGRKESYHLCVNTSGREIKSLVPAIGEYGKLWFEQQ